MLLCITPKGDVEITSTLGVWVGFLGDLISDLRSDRTLPLIWREIEEFQQLPKRNSVYGHQQASMRHAQHLRRVFCVDILSFGCGDGKICVCVCAGKRYIVVSVIRPPSSGRRPDEFAGFRAGPVRLCGVSEGASERRIAGRKRRKRRMRREPNSQNITKPFDLL